MDSALYSGLNSNALMNPDLKLSPSSRRRSTDSKRDLNQIKEKLTRKMAKLKQYITRADGEYRKTKQALESLNSSARSAIKLTTSTSKPRR
jgi:predicted RNA-binding Zn ribbon-like protein